MPMITIQTTPDDLTNLRFAYRPVTEISTSYAVLTNPIFHAPYMRWIDKACRALYDIELPYMEAIIPINSRYYPEFMAPTPLAKIQSIEDDIESFMATPDEVVRKTFKV